MNQPKIPFVKPELSVKELTKELYRVNLLLQEKNDALERSELKRRELFNNISHDLRSPLTSINSHVEYLLSFNDFDISEIHEELCLVKERIGALDAMINDIFFMTSLDEIEFTNTVLKDTNIHDFLNRLQKIYINDRRYASRTLTFETNIDKNVSMYVDPNLIRRAIDNLYSNALKFTSSKSTLSFTCVLDKETITFSLRDTGIGIAKNHISRLFDRSYQVESARTPGNNKGCGLGLSIVKSIIEYHNGTVWCESKLDEGSIFYISLPITQHQ